MAAKKPKCAAGGWFYDMIAALGEVAGSTERTLISPQLDFNRPTLFYDVAIYGGGAAGISLARALSGRGLRIGLFEAGGAEPSLLDPDHPYQGRNLGLPYSIAGSRLRYLGGTTNHWGGWCRPLDPLDFAERAYIPLSGWPISRPDLDPYYEAALELCEVNAAGLGLDAFEHDFGYDGFVHRYVPEMRVRNFLFSAPTRFGIRYRQDLEDADDIECFLDAALVRLLPAAGAIDKSVVKASNGASAEVAADCHVLAMGAIENARLLLHSEVANGSDFVGRCFSDHLGFTIGTALLDFSNRYFTHPVWEGDHRLRVLPHLGLSEDLLRERKLCNLGMVIHRRGQLSLDPLGMGVKGQLDRFAGGYKHEFRVLVRVENTPNPESRVTLTDELDAYGVPRVALNWQVNAFDYRCVDQLSELLAPLLARADGRLKIVRRTTEDGARRLGTYQAHHLGTTRMSADPELGVVDANLRCHDVSNLFVLGSSVFPTFGFANPTLTIGALSLRLAEHLAQTAGKANG